MAWTSLLMHYVVCSRPACVIVDRHIGSGTEHWLPSEPSNIPTQIPEMTIKRNFTLLIITLLSHKHLSLFRFWLLDMKFKHWISYIVSEWKTILWATVSDRHLLIWSHKFHCLHHSLLVTNIQHTHNLLQEHIPVRAKANLVQFIAP